MSSLVRSNCSDRESSCTTEKVDQQLCCTLAKYFSKRTEEERDKTSAMLAKLNTQLQQNSELAKKLSSSNSKLELVKCMHEEKVNEIKQLTENKELLTEKLCALESQMQKLTEENSEKDKKILALKQELNEAKDKNKEMTEDIATLNGEIAALKEDKCLFFSGVAPRREKYDYFNAEILENKKKLETSRRILHLVDKKQEEITKFLLDEINRKSEFLTKCSELINEFKNSNENNKDFVDEVNKQKINDFKEHTNEQLSKELEKCKKDCKRLKEKFDAKNREFFSLTLKYNILRQKVVIDEEIEKSKAKTRRKRSLNKTEK